MSRQGRRSKSINQRVGNRGNERGLARPDAFVTYVMDRPMFRLGRSKHAKELILKALAELDWTTLLVNWPG